MLQAVRGVNTGHRDENLTQKMAALALVLPVPALWQGIGSGRLGVTSRSQLGKRCAAMVTAAQQQLL